MFFHVGLLLFFAPKPLLLFFQVFLLGGRLIFGPDARSLFITISIIVAPIAVFCIFVARKLLDDFQHDLGIFIMAVVIALTIWVISACSWLTILFSSFCAFLAGFAYLLQRLADASWSMFYVYDCSYS